MTVFSYSTLNDPLAAEGTFPTGINNNGQIVGYYVDSSGIDHGFLYSGGTYTTLNDPSGSKGTVAAGINDQGQIVGHYADSSNGLHAFLYSGGTYTTLNGQSGITPTEAIGITRAGEIIGPTASAGIDYVYSAGTYTSFIVATGVVTGINNAGQIIGWNNDIGSIYGFIDINGNFGFGADFSEPSGMNDLGQEIGVNLTGPGAFGPSSFYDGGSYTTLSDPSGTSTTATGLNDADQIVGHYTDSSGATHGFLAVASYPQNPGNNDEWILSGGYWQASAEPGSHPTGYQVAGIGNFTDSSADDILWYNASTGDTDEWQIANAAWAGSIDLGTHPGNYQIAGVGDFTGNGTDDVLWTSSSNGQVQTDIWELSNGQWTASVSPGSHPAGYTVAGIGDFTGNGTSDILWYNSTTGDVDEWQLSNGKWAASVDLGSHPGSGWTVAGVGDFTGNGIDDVLWTNSSSGQVQTDIWELGSNGKWAASVSPGSHPAGYQVAGIGDFTGNGTSDILWQNSATGDIDEWQIAGGKWAASVDLGAHPGNTPVSGVGNFTGNGTSDILFHTSS